ncbi:MAG TPA: acyl-CoA dehydrogenase, partial [Solirubrobacterales bacterium]
MINLEMPKKYKALVSQANQVATEVIRPISRKYDEAEHAYPKELDMLASLIDGMNEGSDMGGAGAAGV